MPVSATAHLCGCPMNMCLYCDTSEELEKTRLEYMEARTELQTDVDAGNKENALEMRSVVNVMETKVR